MASTTTAPDQVSGTWILAAIQPAGQAEVAVPGGASYELSLADGRVSTRADCNVCGGSFAVGSRTMTVGPLLACTRAACPTMAFENAYIAILAGESDMRIDGETLTLTSTRGALRFRR
jgi:heat shock protein HslJ